MINSNQIDVRTLRVEFSELPLAFRDLETRLGESLWSNDVHLFGWNF
jgi:hypothetical protein